MQMHVRNIEASYVVSCQTERKQMVEIFLFRRGHTTACGLEDRLTRASCTKG